ncbi:sensor histidine kinase [Cupriavidus sp. UYPR2.512]|uniref:ATP-binding protein n=1 Tax=Cupriavidus sp. UYPR2.512 TaxID=1080187 RepID=UPI00035C928D|nr:sensor histidine kinase [Cupriavidus sp. UYPR2.512]UIF88158.1 tetratricopeptide repeat protein [Cupriavidus necator]
MHRWQQTGQHCAQRRDRHFLAHALSTWRATPAVALMAILVLAPASAESAPDTLDLWRGRVATIRRLAENDAPAAFRQAQALQEALPPGAGATDKALALNVLARSELYLSRADDAASHAEQALEIARASADRIGQAEAYLTLSATAVNQARIPALVEVTTRILPVLEGVARPDLMGEAMLRTALMYQRLGRIDEAITMCMQSLEIARRTNDPLARAYAHQGLALSFGQTDHKTEALHHYAQMRLEARAAQSKLLEGYALAGLGSTVAEFGDAAAGEALTGEAIANFRMVGSPTGISMGLFALAEQMRERGRLAEALQLLDEVAAIYQRHPNRIGFWYALNARSDNHLAAGDAGRALAEAEHARALAGVIGFPLYLSESARRVAALSASAGDYHRAYDLAAEGAEMAVKAAREKTSARAMALARQYESDSRRRQIDELTTRNLQQKAELSANMLRQQWLWTVLGGSLLMLCGTAFFLLRLRRSHHQLEAVHAQLRQFSTHLESVREEERKRIAMEIHDELGQLLTALKMDVSLLGMKLADPERAKRKLGEMRELVEQTLGKVRHVASHLRPAALNFGIVPALEWLTEDFARRSRSACRLHVHGGGTELNDQQATAVFRIAQESLTNVARHADASVVTVTLDCAIEGITLSVADNGRGFSPDLARHGYSYGLLGMSERARVLRADLLVQSEPGAGTTITVSIPTRTKPQL